MSGEDIPDASVENDTAASDAPNSGEAEKGTIESSVDERDATILDLRDRLARARADYDNLQKRQARDAALERDRVKARVLEDFLKVYEYGKMAEFEADRNPGPLAQGVKMLVQEFDRMLENQGVKPIGNVGDAFDSSLHEAFDTIAVDGVEPGHISKVISTGYQLGDRVLRYAKVTVAPNEEE